MSETPRKHPFKKGATYRVKKSFSSMDDFVEGEILRYEGSSWSRYDEMTGFNFRDTSGKIRRWDFHDEEPLTLCLDMFEERL